MKGAFRRKTKGVYGKALICFQYTVAITLIICTLIIQKQTGFMRSYDLGFAKENVVWLDNRIEATQKDALRSEFERIPGVAGVSFVAGSPIDGGNNNSFNYQDKPVSFQVFKVDSAFFNMLDIEITETGVAESRAGIWVNETAVKELSLGDRPTELNSWYEENDRTASLIGYFSALAIILSMMGILAMATYFIQQRVKEIGVRRVNGATIAEVLQMLISSFMKWILVAFVIACPVAYYAMTEWLSGFAYRTSLDWWLFATAGLFALMVAGLMVGCQSYKAATTNPVESLKSE